MQYVELGDTGIVVSRLCFGTLTMGPLQKDLSPCAGAKLFELAFSLGVNFLDTAQLYATYPHVKLALTIKPDAVVCTKSYAYDSATAEESLRLAQEGIGREYIDLFLLHEQESEHTIRGHYEAIEYFLKKKQQGYIGALGISTHHIAGVTGANKYPELQVVFPICNKSGVGIADGTRLAMEQAVQQAKAKGKGIIGMKPLGGGHLIAQREEALGYVLQNEYIDTIAIGMQTLDEVSYNCAVFSGREPSIEVKEKSASLPRRLHIDDWCEGCGACVARCNNGALYLSEQNGQAKVAQERCVLCGYCASVCPQFCIKVV